MAQICPDKQKGINNGSKSNKYGFKSKKYGPKSKKYSLKSKKYVPKSNKNVLPVFGPPPTISHNKIGLR